MSKLLNALGFQLAWWLCILSVPQGLEPLALALCALLALLHLRFSSARMAEIRLAGLALLTGLLIDSGLQAAGVITFHGAALGALSPYWLWALWLLMALTLRSSLSFLLSRPLALSALAGAVFGPLSYHAGASLGAADWTPSLAHVAALAFCWSLALPLLVGRARTAWASAS